MESLVRALVRDEVDANGEIRARRSTGFVVGLTGRWGLGKSSVVALLALRLGSMEKVMVANFNPWLLKGGDDLLTGFFNSVRSAVGKNLTEEIESLRDDIDRYWGAINFAGTAVATAADPSGLVSKIFTWRPGRTELSPETERKRLEEKIEKLGCAVVVLIDELDRVEDDDVRAVARLIKAVGEIKGVSYLVAYDPRRVAEALGRGNPEAGERYIEKIIQHPIPLRPLFVDDTRALLADSLERFGSTLPAEPSESEQEILDHVIQAIETPREVKRLVGAYSVLEGAVRGEISAYDVLGYCWLNTKAPGIRDIISDNVEAVVDDPGVKEISNRVTQRMDTGKDGDVVSILGSAVAPQRQTIELLFPRFLDHKESGSGNRLSRRRNLVRMLYLGNPPGMVHRTDVERVWSMRGKTLEIELEKLRAAGTLPQLLDRLDDLLEELPAATEDGFWVGLSSSFIRKSDWLFTPEDARSLATDVSTSLMRIGIRDIRQQTRVHRVFDALVKSNDLVIAPWILRKAMRANGYSIHSNTFLREAVFDRVKTKELMDSELPRYRDAILSGFALKRLPTLEVFFALTNAARWDEELKSSLIEQLQGAAAIGTFAALLVPPGFTTELSTIDELCGADELNSRMSELAKHENPYGDPWVAECARRLHRILNGRDPMFADDDDDDDED